MFKKLFKILKGGIELNETNALKGEELKHVLVGSLYAHQQQTYLNSYETGAEKSLRDKILQQWWGITNREEAIGTMQYLFHEGYISIFPFVYQAFQNRNGDYATVIETNATDLEQRDKMVELYRNLINSYEELLENKVISSEEDLMKYGVAGWDLGRAVFIARLCWESEYISLDELKDYTKACYEKLKQHNQTWEDYTKSYVIGRSIWNSNSHNGGMIAIAEELLTHEDSPLRGGGVI